MMPSVDHASVLLYLDGYMKTEDESYLFKALYKFADIYSYDIGSLSVSAVESFDRVYAVDNILEEIVTTFLHIALNRDKVDADLDSYFAALIFAESEDNADRVKVTEDYNMSAE